MAESIPEQVLHYNIIEKAGEGPHSVVYKAYDTGLDRIVALKMFHRSDFGRDMSDHQRRYRVQRISDMKHPHITQVFAAEEYEGRLMIVREFIEGQSMAQLVGSRPLDEAAFYLLATQVIRGLSAAHERHLIHGNIKANNILVGRDGTVAVTDFLFWTPLDLDETGYDDLNRDQAYYIPPERVRGRELKPASDLFSLGVVFYLMLTGTVPFNGQNGSEVLKAVVYERPDLSIFRKRNIRGDTVLLLDKMLAKDPGDRFQNASELLISAEAIVDFEDHYSRQKAILSHGKCPRWYLLVSLAAAILILVWYFVTTAGR
jgi:serine/threonine-protein kinase